MEQDKVLRLLGLASKAGQIAFGSISVIDTIKRNKTKLVIIAKDASEKTKNNIKYIADNNNIQVRIYGNIASISKNIGKNNKAAICIKGINFSKEILKLIDGGETIG